MDDDGHPRHDYSSSAVQWHKELKTKKVWKTGDFSIMVHTDFIKQNGKVHGPFFLV